MLMMWEFTAGVSREQKLRWLCLPLSTHGFETEKIHICLRKTKQQQKQITIYVFKLHKWDDLLGGYLYDEVR